jgi:hypothetical protein
MKFFKSLAYLGLIGLLSSCVSNFKVSTDYDKDVDFEKYATFTFLPWDDDVSTHINEFVQKELYAAAKAEMEKRGYKFVENNADLAVGLSVLIEEKVEYRSDGTVNYNVGYGYYGYGYGGMGMGYSTPTTIREYYYNDGTIIIDVFDEKAKQLIWQGYGFDRLEDNPHKNEEKIPVYMKYIFQKYPLKPGKKK